MGLRVYSYGKSQREVFHVLSTMQKFLVFRFRTKSFTSDIHSIIRSTNLIDQSSTRMLLIVKSRMRTKIHIGLDWKGKVQH